MRVYRAVEPSGRLWRIEVTDAPDVRVRIYAAFEGGGVAGGGIRLDGVGPLGRWLVEHGMTVDDLKPW